MLAILIVEMCAMHRGCSYCSVLGIRWKRFLEFTTNYTVVLGSVRYGDHQGKAPYSTLYNKLISWRSNDMIEEVVGGGRWAVGGCASWSSVCGI